jgi:hypothetical protein
MENEKYSIDYPDVQYGKIVGQSWKHNKVSISIYVSGKHRDGEFVKGRHEKLDFGVDGDGDLTVNGIKKSAYKVYDGD